MAVVAGAGQGLAFSLARPRPEMQTRFRFTKEAIGEAVESALAMRGVESTIVSGPDLIEDN